MRISDWSSDVCSSDLALPAPSYRPFLPKRVLEDKILSAAQLETIVHALAATEIELPGRYRLPEKGIELVPQADGNCYRQRFFLGDGTGARTEERRVGKEWVRTGRSRWETVK